MILNLAQFYRVASVSNQRVRVISISIIALSVDQWRMGKSSSMSDQVEVEQQLQAEERSVSSDGDDSSNAGEGDADSLATLSGSSHAGGDDDKNDVNSRRLRAMQDLLDHHILSAVDGEQQQHQQVQPTGSNFEAAAARNEAQLAALSDGHRQILLELANMMNPERLYDLFPEVADEKERDGIRQQDVLRAKVLLMPSRTAQQAQEQEVSQQQSTFTADTDTNANTSSKVDLNAKILPFGETLLSASVCHGVEMLSLLLECGADPNVENDMAGETAYDKVEEYLQEGESPDLLQMKQSLLDWGAICFEERMAKL